MKVSGFVLDVDEARDRVFDWAAQGKVARVRLQVEAWPHAEKNRDDFALWKERLNPLGVAVDATVWCDDVAALAARIPKHRADVAPDGWCLNIESPPKANEGAAMTSLMQATKPEPVAVSYNVVAQSLGFDFRRFAMRGALIEGQCYDPDGDSNKGPEPAAHVTAAFRPTVCWAGGGGPAWWYRVRVGTAWSWRQVVGLAGDRLQMKSPTGNVVWAEGLWAADHLEFAPSRAVWSAQQGGSIVGRVFGFATYWRIGYSLGTTRAIVPEKTRCRSSSWASTARSSSPTSAASQARPSSATGPPGACPGSSARTRSRSPRSSAELGRPQRYEAGTRLPRRRHRAHRAHAPAVRAHDARRAGCGHCGRPRHLRLSRGLRPAAKDATAMIRLLALLAALTVAAGVAIFPPPHACHHRHHHSDVCIAKVRPV